MKDLNGEDYNFEKAVKNVYYKYPDAFDNTEVVRWTADYLNELYQDGGEEAVDGWFRDCATDEYKHDYKALVFAG